jgi:hypothetical protein
MLLMTDLAKGKLMVVVTLLVSLMLLFPSTGHASIHDTNGDGRVTILLPIAFTHHVRVPGAHGSEWRMELWFHNASSHGFNSLQGGCTVFCHELNYPPGYLGLYTSIGSIGGAAALLTIPASNEPEIHLSARLLETTRLAQPTGVDLPVVREGEFRKRETTLLAVPVGSTIRSALRVYDPRLRRGSRVHAEFLSPAGEVIAAAWLAPGDHPSLALQDPQFPRTAGYDAILDLTGQFPLLQSLPLFHVRLTGETPDLEYWAMVSVTENETQHVMLITP